MIPSGDLWLAPLTRLRADLPGNVPGPHAAEYYAQRSGRWCSVLTKPPRCPGDQVLQNARFAYWKHKQKRGSP